MHLTYDATTDAAYLELRVPAAGDVLGPAVMLERDPGFSGMVIADVTLADGALVGIEFLRASTYLDSELLATAERIDGGHLARRMEARFMRVPAGASPVAERGRNVSH